MPGRNGGLLIIVANEPRSFRDALTGVLRHARPQDSVVPVDPLEVDEALKRRRGALVVCSDVSPAVEQHAGAWVRLGENGEVEISRPDVEAAAVQPNGLAAVLEAVNAAGTGLAHLR
jgi:hypothetical protein